MAGRNDNRMYDGTNDSSSNLGQLNDAAKLLKQASENFLQVTKSINNLDKGMDDSTTDLRKAFDKFNKEGDKRLSTGQKIGQTLITSFKSVFSYVLKQFTNQFSNIVNNYNENLEKITTRMQKTNHEYSEMLLEHTRQIRSDNLRTQFSQIDWSNALVPVLEQGIRGGLAEEMAYRNMITNRLLPMISTNTREYTRMSKVFGKTFTDGITAISTYSERMLENAEGLEENNLNDVITTAYREVMEQVRREGGSATDVTSRMQEIIGAYQTASDAYGSQTAMELLQKYTQALSGNAVMSGNFDEGLLGVINGARTFEDFISGVEQFTNRYASSMPSGYASSAFGFSQTTVQDLLSYGYFGQGRKNTDELFKDFDTTAETSENMLKLQKGYYRSVTDQMDTFNQNLMAELGTWSAEYIPHSVETLSAIWSLLGDWFKIWVTASGGGTVSSLLGGSGGIGTAGASGGFGSKAKNLATAAGIAWMAGDAISGFSSDSEAGTGTKVGNAASKALTGATYSEYSKMSAGEAWGTIGGNTAKGALVGAKGGIWGVLAGAALGFIGSGVMAATAWFDEENARNRKIEESTELLKQNSDALDEYNQRFESASTAREALNVLEDERKKGTEDYYKALKALGPEYRDIIGAVNEETELTPNQLSQLEKRIELLQQENYWTAVNNREEVDTVDLWKTLAEAQSEYTSNRAQGSIWQAVQGIETSDITSLSRLPKSGQLKDLYDLYLQTAEGQKNTGIEGFKQYLLSEKLNTLGHPDIEDTETADLQQIQQSLVSAKSAVLDNAQFIAAALMAGQTPSTKDFERISESYNLADDAGKQDIKDLVVPVLEPYFEQEKVKSVKQLSEKYGYDDFKGNFRSGLYSVPYDNYLANVHANEMILPSQASDNLRALSGATSISGISAYLASQVASPVADSSAASQISYIIQVQTETLSSILESILDRVGSIHNILDGRARRTASAPEPIPESVVKYQSIPY